MTSGSITSWQREGEMVKAVTDFIFLGSKSLQTVTAALKVKDVCSLKEKLGPTKFYIVKAIIFPVVMYGCESWSIKKAKP